MKIKIGADELILWFRKNKIANDIDTIQLGRKILNLTESIGGKKFKDDAPTYWPEYLDEELLNAKGLPKTSEQYEIDTSSLQKLYEGLNNF